MKEEPTNVLKLENMTDSKTIVHQDEDLGLVTLIINVTLPNGEITRVDRWCGRCTTTCASRTMASRRWGGTSACAGSSEA
jgi:hypothetical protein